MSDDDEHPPEGSVEDGDSTTAADFFDHEPSKQEKIDVSR